MRLFTDAVVEASSEASEKLTVETSNNHVYFYSEVNSDRCLALVKQLRTLDEQLRGERLSRSLPLDYPKVPIWLHVYSPGGSPAAAMAVADQLALIESPVFSLVEGYCASAATLISMACDRRYIMPSGFLLIHQVSTIAWGTYEQLKDEIHYLDMVMDSLIEFYSSRSKMSGDEVKKLLQRDSWFNATQAVEKGLADEIFSGGSI